MRQHQEKKRRLRKNDADGISACLSHQKLKKIWTPTGTFSRV